MIKYISYRINFMNLALVIRGDYKGKVILVTVDNSCFVKQ